MAPERRTVDRVSELDPAQLRARLDGLVAARWPSAQISEITRMPAGVSSLAYRVRFDPTRAQAPTDLVLKVAPVGLPPTHNRDVLRQARILNAVRSSGEVPVPAIALTDDTALPPLFAMELLSGSSYEPGTDIAESGAPSPEQVKARVRAAAQALAALQALDLSALGIADELVVTPADELARWSRLLETVDDGLAPGHDALRTRLTAHIPALSARVLVHGDYRLANMLFTGTDLQGVIDWEIWSVGDPRHDVAWLLMHSDPPHRFHRDRPAADERAGAALPTPDEVLDWMAAAGAPVAQLSVDLPWFLALSHYKVASTVAVLAKRNLRQPQPAERLVIAQESLAHVVEAGHHWLDRA